VSSIVKDQGLLEIERCTDPYPGDAALASVCVQDNAARPSL